MTDQDDSLKIAPGFPESSHPLFHTQDEQEHFWQQFYTRIQGKMEHWNNARAESEEETRNLWLRR